MFFDFIHMATEVSFHSVLARIAIVIAHYTKGSRKALIMLFIYYSIVRAVVAAPRVEKMAISQGCHPMRGF